MRVLSQIIPILIFLILPSATWAEDGVLAEIPIDFPTQKSPYTVTSDVPHDMRIINSGSASLYARIDMIRRAKHTIELETFIYNDDTSGRIIMQELLAAAKRGVKVRVLVDKAINNIELDEYHAQLLKEQGIELRFYNDASILTFSTVQYRNHRKLMVCDDKEAIAGGRNIADEYFDLSKKLNFLDRDATVEGEIVKDMRATFDLFWDSKMTETPKPIELPLMEHYLSDDSVEARYSQALEYYKYKMRKAKNLLSMKPGDEKKLEFILRAGKKSFLDNNKYKCPEISFASDKEGAGFLENSSGKYRRNFRHLKKEISKWLKKKVTKELTVDTPYFLDNAFTDDIDLKLASNIKVNLLTNGLATTDAIHVSSVFYDFISKFTPNENFKAYTYKGKFTGEGELYSDQVRKSTWGTHSKTMVFNDNSFTIGSNNMDNRSREYNTELAVFCSGSPELTKDILDNIQKRMGGSNRLNLEGNPDDCSDPFEEVSSLKKALFYLLKIPSHMFQFLL